MNWITKKYDRRAFAKTVSMSAFVLSIHPGGLIASENAVKKKKPTGFPLIQSIRLLTAVSLDRMKAFYHDGLCFPVLDESSAGITFQAGKSILEFVKVPESSDNPWYHFAFNIPENKIREARLWQLKRSAIIPTPPRSRDRNFPDDVRHFPHWNAHSVFFWDPAGNLLEYIARHDLDNTTDTPFRAEDIQYISEIAFVVNDQEKNARLLNKHFNLDVYPKSNRFWWAMGDEEGLLLCIPKRIWGENTDDPRRFQIFKTEAKIGGLNHKSFEFPDYPYKIEVT